MFEKIAYPTALFLLVLTVAGLWKVFEKAGRPGWPAMIPLYNMAPICEIAGKPSSWLLWMLIPGVSIVIWIRIMIGLAKNFGKSTAFGLGCAILLFIYIPILGFGKAQYIGGKET